MRQIKRSEIQISIETEPSDIPLEGNLIDSGDPETDERVIQEVLDRLNDGDHEAWCTIVVTARAAGFEGQDVLGGGSLSEEYDANTAVEENGMIDEAIADLMQEIRAAGWEAELVQ